MDNKKLNTRWRYYIDKSFQNQFIYRFSGVVILVAVITLGILWLIQENPYGLLPDNSGLLVSINPDKTMACTASDGSQIDLPVPGKAYNAFELFWAPILFVTVVNLVIIIVFSLFYSHSMAGPIHNIKMRLSDLADGKEAEPIRIRKGDQFQELVSLLNKVIEKRVK